MLALQQAVVKGGSSEVTAALLPYDGQISRGEPSASAW